MGQSELRHSRLHAVSNLPPLASTGISETLTSAPHVAHGESSKIRTSVPRVTMQVNIAVTIDNPPAVGDALREHVARLNAGEGGLIPTHGYGESETVAQDRLEQPGEAISPRKTG